MEHDPCDRLRNAYCDGAVVATIISGWATNLFV